MQETPVWFLGREDFWRRDRLPTPVFLGFQSLDWEDPPEKEKATHSSILAWVIHGGRKELDMTEQLSLSYL